MRTEQLGNGTGTGSETTGTGRKQTMRTLNLVVAFMVSVVLAFGSIVPADAQTAVERDNVVSFGSVPADAQTDNRRPILASALRLASQTTATAGQRPSYSVPKGKAVGGLIGGLVGAVWVITEMTRSDGWLQSNWGGEGFSSDGLASLLAGTALTAVGFGVMNSALAEPDKKMEQWEAAERERQEAERQRLAAERRERQRQEAAERRERERLADERRQERERQEAAEREAERQRLAAERRERQPTDQDNATHCVEVQWTIPYDPIGDNTRVWHYFEVHNSCTFEITVYTTSNATEVGFERDRDTDWDLSWHVEFFPPFNLGPEQWTADTVSSFTGRELGLSDDGRQLFANPSGRYVPVDAGVDPQLILCATGSDVTAEQSICLNQTPREMERIR